MTAADSTAADSVVADSVVADSVVARATAADVTGARSSMVAGDPGSAGPATTSQPGETAVTAENSATDQHGQAAAESPGAPTRGTLADWLVVGLITLLAAWTAVLGMAFLPQYIGPVPFPISALLGVAAMTLAPRAAYRLTGSMVAALLPVAAWFGISVWLVLARNSLMGGLPVTVINGQWRVMVLLGLGSLAAAATIGLIWGDRLRLRIAAQQAAAKARDDSWVPDKATDQS